MEMVESNNKLKKQSIKKPILKRHNKRPLTLLATITFSCLSIIFFITSAVFLSSNCKKYDEFLATYPHTPEYHAAIQKETESLNKRYENYFAQISENNQIAALSENYQKELAALQSKENVEYLLLSEEGNTSNAARKAKSAENLSRKVFWGSLGSMGASVGLLFLAYNTIRKEETEETLER